MVLLFFVLALVFGILFTTPIGGADMPVVISLFNAFTGLAVAFEGFVLGNAAMIIAGTVVGSAGTLLTQLMAKAMNRPITNILFASFGSDLPAFTLMVVGLSDFMIEWWWAVFGSIAIVVISLSQTYKRSRAFRDMLDRTYLKLPVISALTKNSSIARFSRTLSTMFAAGVPLVEAMDSVAGADVPVGVDVPIDGQPDSAATRDGLRVPGPGDVDAAGRNDVLFDAGDSLQDRCAAPLLHRLGHLAVAVGDGMSGAGRDAGVVRADARIHGGDRAPSISRPCPIQHFQPTCRHNFVP